MADVETTRGPSGADNGAAWDRLADAYQRWVGWPEDVLTWGIRCPPEEDLHLVTDVADGARTLVLGCGAGEDLVALARLGAGPLTGIDPSQRQLAHAGRRCDAAGLDVTLVASGAEDLDAVADASQDLVVSVQALDYVRDLDRCLAEVHRVLVPGGVVALSVLHPADLATSGDPPHGWHRSYFTEELAWAWDGLVDEDVALTSWFRSPSTWFTACTRAGLVVERLLEPRPVDDERWIERGWLDATGYAKADLVPSTILVRARRP
ncbi:class I SAM-dependent methyltransferase [Nitriliruptor alkaliphilus]|uniref:class I SAM-dependent methyltransferase n=1 Tax=Nitriliruptor alkaliphilus TaxID=427918 RepID=UPI0006979B57|nr:class I SAM-dependent methyltransferase [Nitriliruptor alkaliphilus]